MLYGDTTLRELLSGCMLRPVVFLNSVWAASCCSRGLSGRGSAWLERLVRDQEVGGSNPLAPTNLIPITASNYAAFAG